LVGIAVFWQLRAFYATGRVQVKRGRYAHVRDVVRKLDDEKLTRSLTEAGLPLHAMQYQVLRYTILSVWLLTAIGQSGLKGGDLSGTLFQVLVVYALSSPVPTVFNRKTPFAWMMDYLGDRRKYRKSLELYRAISQLKNLMIVK